MFEDGKAMAPKSWEMVRLEERNKSILQFFSSKGPPLQKLSTENWVSSGDFGSNSGVKGQGGEVKLSFKTGLNTACINTTGKRSQASLCVELLNLSDQTQKSNNP